MIQFWNSVNSPSILNFNKLVKEDKVKAALRHLFPLSLSSLMFIKSIYPGMFVGISLSNTNCRHLSLTMDKQSKKTKKVPCLSDQSPLMIC